MENDAAGSIEIHAYGSGSVFYSTKSLLEQVILSQIPRFVVPSVIERRRFGFELQGLVAVTQCLTQEHRELSQRVEERDSRDKRDTLCEKITTRQYTLGEKHDHTSESNAVFQCLRIPLNKRHTPELLFRSYGS